MMRGLRWLACGAAAVFVLSTGQAFSDEVGVDRPGSDYTNFDLPYADPSRCRTECEGQPRCAAWTYVKPGVQGPTARCWLKSKVPAPLANSCCVSGVRTAAPIVRPPDMPPGGEAWRLTQKVYPVLPESIVAVTKGRGAGSSIKVRRTGRPDEVNYIRIEVTRGNLECRVVGALRWDGGLPETIVTGKEVMIQLEARIDLYEGTGCGGGGRISVSYGSRAEPLRNRAPNIVQLNAAAAEANSGSRKSTERFRIDARPGLPGNDFFTVAIHISDGGVTDKVVALYTYEKIKRY